MSPLPHSPRAVAMITALVRGEAAAYKVRFAAAAASNPPRKTSPPSLPSSACCNRRAEGLRNLAATNVSRVSPVAALGFPQQELICSRLFAGFAC